MGMSEFPLRYGMNPDQIPARTFTPQGELPIKSLNGSPSLINMLDLLHGWQLVRELKAALALPAAASYKHVSPAGAAVGLPLSDALRRAYFVGNSSLSPLASAYARARGADRLCSFGDAVALSDVCDASAATLIAREVSDAVIAPGYQPEALAVLRRKRGGRYLILQVDPDYEPPQMERRDLFGITLEQRRNDRPIAHDVFDRIVTTRADLPEAARRDLLVATITLKYTQSNSVCLAFDGQVIGLGAGQQSRVHCVRLAVAKARRWWLRQHPKVLALSFQKQLARSSRNNVIEQYLQGDWNRHADQLSKSFRSSPQPLSESE